MADDLVGREFRSYIITQALGRGGMAVVYLAEQTSMDRPVAIKIIAKTLSDDSDFRERFEQEARTIGALAHPHILPVIDYGEEDFGAFLVMRYVKGGTLEHRLKAGPLTLAETRDMLDKIGSALDYAHSEGVIHRDLKPANILLDDSGNPYLTDFGIAKILRSTKKLTQTGMAIGTPAYMAPEQWKSEPLGPYTDIYALGVMLYEMITGDQPFWAETTYGYMHKHIFETPAPPRAMIAQLPEAAEAVVLRALAKDPTERYDSARLLSEAFSAALMETAHPPLAQTSPAPARQAAAPTRMAQSPPQDVLPDEPTMLTPPPVAVEKSAAPRRAAPPRRQGLLVMAAGAIITVLVVSALLLGSGVFSAAEETPTTAATTAAALVPSETNEPTDTAAPSPTAAGSDTPEPSQTPTNTASVTPTATATASHTATPATPELALTRGIAARGGPGSQYPTIAQLTAEDRLAITGISEDGAWYQVILPDGGLGWVTASSLVSASGDLSIVPIVAAPTNTPTDTPTASPTLTPSDTPTATATASFTPTNTPIPTDTPTASPSPTAVLTRIAILATRTPTRQPPSRTPTNTPTPTSAVTGCEELLPSMLRPGERGLVNDQDSRPLNLRDSAGLGGSILDRLPVRTEFDVLQGPLCRDGYPWFRVQTIIDDVTGWAAESGEGVYYAVPIVDGQRFRTEDCPDVLPTRLRPGSTAVIDTPTDRPLRLRDGPNSSAALLGLVNEGVHLTILRGHVCSDGYLWWEYLTSDGRTGWSSEADEDSYFIAPLR